MLNLQICPRCGELYNADGYCASAKCLALDSFECLEYVSAEPETNQTDSREDFAMEIESDEHSTA